MKQKEATKLCDKQIQQTLGGIEKKRKLKVFRNSLEFPYNKIWPAVNVTDAEELINLLEKLLPRAKISIVKPLWKEVCKLSKEERKRAKGNIKVKRDNQNVTYRSFILPGYSAVTRGLEKGELCCCILAKEIEPLILIKTMVSLAQSKKVPVLVIPSLRSLLHKTLDFSAMAIGFKVSVGEDPDCIFHPIFKCIEELNKKFHATEEKNIQTQSIILHDNQESKSEKTNDKTNFHLLATSGNGPRVFIPPREHNETSVSSDKNGLSFISIDNDDTRNVESIRNAHFKTNSKDEESEDDDIDCNEIFQIDTKPDALLKKSWEGTKNHKKRKKPKQLSNPLYHPTKIKVIKSNPMKASKKKKKKGTNT